MLGVVVLTKEDMLCATLVRSLEETASNSDDNNVPLTLFPIW